MDNGPDSKRPRLNSGPEPWPSNPQNRGLPAGPPPQATYGHPPPPPQPPYSRPESQSLPPPQLLIDRDRRHEHEYHAPQSHDPHRPPPHPYSYSHPPRDPMVKRDPGDEQVSILNSRPRSTGPVQENHTNQSPLSHQPPSTVPPPPPMQSNYEPPPGTPIQGHGPPPQMNYRPPSTPQYAQVHSPMTQTQPPYPSIPVASYGPHRDSIYAPPTVSFTPSANQRRKTQRASQACDSCRSLKAKCDEMRPCSNCSEKNMTCNYRDPPPKQGDKVQLEMMNILKTMAEDISTVKETQMTEFGQFRKDLEQMRRLFYERDPDAEKMFKQEPLNENGVESPRSRMNGHVDEGDDHTVMETETGPYSPESPPGEHMSLDDEEYGDPAPLGEPTIPANHTTGAARLLLHPAISSLLGEDLKLDKVKNEKYPIICEEKRGLLRLFGRGEGLDLGQGYEKEPAVDHDTDKSDTLSDASPSPAAENRWGQIGGLSPPAGVEIIRRTGDESLGGLSQVGVLELDQPTVTRLVDKYMKHINIMHPILYPRQVEKLVRNFLKNTPEPSARTKPMAAFVGSHGNGNVPTGTNYSPGESPANKRKRSPVAAEHPEIINGVTMKPGKPPRTITTALVLMMLALGKICEHKTKIPDVIHDSSTSSSHGSPFMRNSARPSSPLHQSPPSASPQSSGLPSPQEMDRIPSSRRDSVELTHKPHLRNLDVIPGLAYFAIATDIIGNQLGGNSLEHVHVNILAGLYHGQLGRVLESHTYIHQACRALQSILRPKMERFRKLQENNEKPLAKDNPILFAFWTCLQLESDILAELPCPHSGILSYESMMPYPNLTAAQENGLEVRILDSYQGQLWLRKHLNLLHNMFYRPSPPENGDKKPAMSEEERFLTEVASMEETLTNAIVMFSKQLRFEEHDPPSNDILAARLRAKFYGAQVITYRPFIVKILEMSMKDQNSALEGFGRIPLGLQNSNAVVNLGDGPGTSVSPKYMEYAQKCIIALEKSTTAFHGVTGGRIIVTNVWGTAHAQWGNLLVLQAAYRDPNLKKFINASNLRTLLWKTIKFLEDVAQPSSALYIDLKILKHTASIVQLKPIDNLSSSFSSNHST